MRVFFGFLIFFQLMPLAKGENLIEGNLGTLHYRSEILDTGNIQVTFERPTDTIVVDIALNIQKAKMSYPLGAAITASDREQFQQLAWMIESEVGKSSVVADQLLRQAALFGAHPIAPLKITEVSGFQLLGWQTLCTGAVPSSRAFEWDVGSTVHREVLPYGPTDSTCSARCGAGCYGVGTSAWTQDCGNHDYCEKYSATSDCMDEFLAASDDFSFAPNCSY